MTITFPRALHEPAHIIRCTVKPLHQHVRAPSRGGNPGVASIGRDLWRFEYQTRALREAEALAWEAWLATLRGGLRPFRAEHPLRASLYHYRGGMAGLTRSGGGAFDGSAVVVSVTTALDAVTINTLPAALKFAPGDLISLTYASGLQALHRVVEEATASGLGAVTLSVEPSLVPGLTAGAAVQLSRPWCLATIDEGSPAVQWLPGRRGDGLRFSAVQAF